MHFSVRRKIKHKPRRRRTYMCMRSMAGGEVRNGGIACTASSCIVIGGGYYMLYYILVYYTAGATGFVFRPAPRPSTLCIPIYICIIIYYTKIYYNILWSSVFFFKRKQKNCLTLPLLFKSPHIRNVAGGCSRPANPCIIIIIILGRS